MQTVVSIDSKEVERVYAEIGRRLGQLPFVVEAYAFVEGSRFAGMPEAYLPLFKVRAYIQELDYDNEVKLGEVDAEIARAFPRYIFDFQTLPLGETNSQPPKHYKKIMEKTGTK